MSFGPIVRFWAAADYEPSLRFYDHMYAVAQEHKPNFEHWWTNRLAVVLHDYEHHDLLVITHKRCTFEAANPDDFDSSVNRLTDVTRQVINKVSHGPLKRMGFQLVVYADLGLTFEELMNQLRPLCLPKNERLETLTSSEISDIALHFDYDHNGGTVKVRVGPMKRDQGLEMIKNVGEHNKLFAPPDKGTDLSDFYGKIPNTFLFFEIEVFTEQEHGADEWPDFVQKAESHARSVFEGIRAILMEEET